MKAAWMLTALAVMALLLGCQDKSQPPEQLPPEQPPPPPAYPTEQIPLPEPQPAPAAAPAPALEPVAPPAEVDEEPAPAKPAAAPKPRASTRTRERDSVAAAPKAKTHTVKKGETLQEISQKYYGTTKHYMAIAKANNIKNVNKLKVGTKLVIPDIKK